MTQAAPPAVRQTAQAEQSGYTTCTETSHMERAEHSALGPPPPPLGHVIYSTTFGRKAMYNHQANTLQHSALLLALHAAGSIKFVVRPT